MSTSFRNAEDRNWRRNLKLFSESSSCLMMGREDGGPTCSRAGDKPAGGCRDAPVSLLSSVVLFTFHSCYVLSLCFLPLLLLNCLDLVQMANSHTYFTVISPLPWGSRESRLFPLILPLGHHVLIGCKMWKICLSIFLFIRHCQCYRIKSYT